MNFQLYNIKCLVLKNYNNALVPYPCDKFGLNAVKRIDAKMQYQYRYHYKK